MDTLQVISLFAPIVSAITAIIAAVFVSWQISHIRRSREVDTLFKIIALSDLEDTREAKEWLMYELGKGLTIQQLKADKATMRKFGQVVHLFETMGVIVNRGYVSKDLVFDKYGLLIIGAWGKLQSPITAIRIESQNYEYAENFELLVSKYDIWARKTALKTSKGERVKLKEARHSLDYTKEKQDGQSD